MLESCTGGLMYRYILISIYLLITKFLNWEHLFSHELQTCDWPRNVGCDGTAESVTTPAVTYSSSSSSRRPESKIRYTHPPPPPPAQPAAVVTSRGQPRQLHHSEQEVLKVPNYRLFSNN